MKFSSYLTWAEGEDICGEQFYTIGEAEEKARRITAKTGKQVNVIEINLIGTSRLTNRTPKYFVEYQSFEGEKSK